MATGTPNHSRMTFTIRPHVEDEWNEIYGRYCSAIVGYDVYRESDNRKEIVAHVDTRPEAELIVERLDTIWGNTKS